jgi:nucleoside-diphosphate-sugar epimerase
MKRPRVLITGASGFVGQAIGDYLEMQANFDVFGCDLNNHHAVDILDSQTLSTIATNFRPDTLIHAAAITTATRADELDLIKVNVQGTINALKAARAAQAQHFILLSSAGVYAPEQPTPITEDGLLSSHKAYSLSKTLAEAACELSDMTVWILRLAAIYGANEHPSPTRKNSSLIHQIARQSNQSQTQLTRASTDEYNFLHTTDLGRLLELIIKKNPDHQTHLYNIGGKTQTVFEIFSTYQKLYNLSTQPIWNNDPTPRHSAISSSKIKNELKFTPKITLEQGLLDYPPKKFVSPKQK